MNDKILDLFESLFGNMLEWIIGPFVDLYTWNELIYGKAGEVKYFGVFNEAQWGVVAQGMAVMQSLSVGFILISIILAGMRISSAGINPSNRTYALEYFKDFIVVALLFFNLSTIFELIYSVNEMFVLSFSSAKEIMEGGIKEQVEPFIKQGVLGGLIIGLVMLGLWLWANFYYMMRTLTLMILTIMSPLAVAFYLIPQTKGITVGLFKEYVGTVFVQSVHAALYWIITSIATGDFGLGSILLYMIFIPVSESIRSLLGLGGQMNDRLTKSAAMFGGAALTGVYGSIRGALSGQSVAQSLRGAAGQVADRMKGKNGETDPDNDPKTMLGGAGTDIGSTARAERMLKAGEILSKGGKAVFGAAGAIAGSPMGPMGAIAGSTLGFQTGGVIGGVAGRAGWAGGEFVGHRIKEGLKSGWNKGKGIKNAESLADEKLANSIAEDETTNWANQNKEEFMKDNKEKFPDITDASREQMWQDKVSGKRGEFLNQARTKVGELKSLDGKMAQGSDLVQSATDNLTNNWAENNKDQFMSDYDKNNPLPAEPTEGDIIKHNQNKNAAWKQALEGKKNTFNDIAKQAAEKLSGKSNIDSMLNKEDFSKQISAEVGSALGGGEKEGVIAVQAALGSVKGQMAQGSKLAKATTDNLTNEWAKNNKDQFMRDYESNNPLPPNATEADLLKHNQNKTSAWQQAVEGKRKNFSNIADKAIEKLKPHSDPNISKDEFISQVGNNIASVIGVDKKDGVVAVQAAVGSLKGQMVQGTKIAKATTDHLTSEWANKHEAPFMKNYEDINPVPPNATEAQLVQYNQSKSSAWQQVVEGKRKQISDIAGKAIESLNVSPSNTSAGSYISKEAFAKEVGLGVASVNGIGERESIQAVKTATNSVKGASLYSMKSVNTDYLQNHLASQRAGQEREGYVQTQMQQNGMTKDQAVKSWETTGHQKAFEKNLDSLQEKMPHNLKLDHAVIRNSPIRGAAALGGGIATGVISATGIPQGIKQTSSFISDTKLGTGIKAIPLGFKTAWDNKDVYQNPVTATVGAIGSSVKFGIEQAKSHTAQNVIGKQIAFKDAVAFTTGIVGGVRGYRAGATYASGGTTNTKQFGLKGFNPYNNAVNEQVSEISQIQQMAQTSTGPNGQQMVASGALRMVTTREQTIIQVKDKSGRIQTVSRVGSGDSGLGKGVTLFQDLTIQDGQMAPASNVYQEDSGGGRITSNKRINVNPNKLVANRNKPNNPRVVKDVQSYNQLVDSGQYYLQDAMKEMSNIKMVVDRNRSYLVGQKDDNEYRISPYGPGDTRLKVEEVITRTCEARNSKLVLAPSDDSYTSSQKPMDLSPEKLAPFRPPNKRNINRKQNDAVRNKSFTGSLG